MTSNMNDQPVALYQSTAGNNLPSTDFRESVPDAFEEEINLRDYIEVMIRRKWIIIGALFLTFISVLIFSLAAQKQYLASGTLEVSTETQKLTKFEDVVNDSVRSQEFVATQVSLLKSQTLAERVSQSLNLKEDPIFADDFQKDDDKPGMIAQLKTAIHAFFQKDSENRPDSQLLTETMEENKVLEFFTDNLTVSPRRDSMIIDVSFISPSRQLSQDVVNRLITEFISWKMDQKVTSSGTAREYLMMQIDRAKINLEESEEKQNQFARKAGIVSMDSRLNSVFKQLEDINTALGQAEAEYISKETLYKQAEKDGPESLPQVLTSTLINDLKSEYAKHRSEYEQLSETFHEDYPDVKTIKSRMNSIESRINSESQKIFDSIKYDYLSAKSKLDSLRANMEQKKKLALDLNERATQYTIMTREVETNKAIYQSLLERAKEIESMAGISPSNIQIVDKASLPIFPAKPNVPRNLMLAIILGLMGGIGAAFTMEYFADTITNPEQISDRFQIPILGVLPLEAASTEYPIERIFTKNPRASISEALRTLRVSIQLSGSGANSRSIVITSTCPGEGKTTASANLAQAFAGAGEKVLLIDADLRKPRLHKIFQAASASNDGRGLSSFLAGVVNDGFIAKTSVENLYLIPSGPIPPNPVELLASNRFSQLIAKSSEEFDRILIDAPPHLGYADVLVLSRQVGGVILVSGIGETTRDGIRHFKKSILNVQGTILGCIVNKINLSQRYGYRSYYRYYKAYNYEYGKKSKDIGLDKPLPSEHLAA